MDMDRVRKLPKPIDWIADFPDLSDVDAICKFFRQFQDEFDNLKHADSTIESNDKPTIGALVSPDGRTQLTPSQLLYREDFPEVNRTCVSMLCLKWLIKRDYSSFTANQSPRVKMSQSSFDYLCDLVQEATKSGAQELTALLVAVVVGDIGKDPGLETDVRAKLAELGESVEMRNHDDVVYEAAKHDMLKSLNLLRHDFRQDVILGLQVGSNINVPQLAQAENVPGSLQKISALKGKERAFLLKYIEIILDVSGAGGHVDSRSAIRMIEPVFRSYSSCRSALENIIQGRKSIRQGYDQVLQQRGKLLDSQGLGSLHVDIPSERAILRLMCMARVDNRSDAESIISAFDSLRNTTRQRLIDGLSVDGIDDGEAILLYYIPGLFAEVNKVMWDSSPSKKIDALRSLMRFMARVYNGSKPNPGQPGSVTERNIGFAAKTITSQEFKSRPAVLDELKLPWT